MIPLEHVDFSLCLIRADYADQQKLSYQITFAANGKSKKHTN